MAADGLGVLRESPPLTPKLLSYFVVVVLLLIILSPWFVLLCLVLPMLLVRRTWCLQREPAALVVVYHGMGWLRYRRTRLLKVSWVRVDRDDEVGWVVMLGDVTYVMEPLLWFESIESAKEMAVQVAEYWRIENRGVAVDTWTGKLNALD